MAKDVIALHSPWYLLSGAKVVAKMAPIERDHVTAHACFCRVLQEGRGWQLGRGCEPFRWTLQLHDACFGKASSSVTQQK